jgi:predicted DNA-binding transcriptional regulator YafY
MLRLHQRLMEGRYPNCRQMAEEFEVAAKTVQRDINFMRDQMRLPIEYDKARFGFHYTRPVIALPAMDLSPVKRSGAAWRRPQPPAIGERPALGSGRGGVPVRIGFDTDAARAVRERTWHASQVIRTLPGGAIEMTLRARDEAAIAHWVLSWGARAWVIEPARLRTRVKELAREIMAKHRG